MSVQWLVLQKYLDCKWVHVEIARGDSADNYNHRSKLKTICPRSPAHRADLDDEPRLRAGGARSPESAP